ncbi:MAG TPA: RHS repeat-associated core domain-containing protein [Acidimicrobiales bacterium]
MDTSLQRGMDGQWRPVASPAQLVFSGGGPGAMAKVLSLGKWISVSWPGGPVPAPSVSGSTATYTNVLPGVDLVLTASVQGMREVLRINSPTAAADPGLGSLRFEVAGAHLSAGGAGSASSADHLLVPSPVWWDSSSPGASVDGPGMGEGGRPVSDVVSADSVSIDAASPARSTGVSFPVFVDPVVLNNYINYTYVDVRYPNQSYFDNTSFQHVGYVTSGDGTHVARSFWEMDSSNIMGTTIANAVWNIYPEWSYSCTPEPVSAYLTGPIGPGTTWNAQPAQLTGQDTQTFAQQNPYFPGGNPNTACPTNGNPIQFNVTNAIQQAVANGWTNTTLGLYTNESNPYYWKQVSDGATLEVSYYHTPSTPSGLSVTPCSSQCSPPVVTTSLNPNLTATATDSDNLSLDYHYQVWAGYSSLPSSEVAAGTQSNVGSGAQSSWQVPSGLASGGQYEYRVQDCVDQWNTVCSGWSGWEQFTVANTPSAPQSVSATGGDSQATVTWSAPASNGGSAIDQFSVTPYNTTTATAGSATLVCATCYSARITGLTGGDSYYFTVAAHNANGYGPGANSNTVAVTGTVRAGGTTPYLGLENWWSYVTSPVGPQASAGVNVSDGNLVLQQTDSTPVNGHGPLGMIVERTYNSEDATALSFPGSFGTGWTLNVGEADNLVGSGVGTSGIFFGSGAATDLLNSPLNVVLVDRDGTHHTFVPQPVSAPSGALGQLAEGGTGSLTGATKLMETILSSGNPGVVFYPSPGANATLCIDQGYTAPPGVHLGLWRYVALTGQAAAGTCSPASGTVTSLAGYAAERPDGLRYVWAPTGELLSLTSRAGTQLAYGYQTLPVLSAAPTALGRLRYVVESSVPNCSPNAQGWTPPSTCRSLQFAYSNPANPSCPVDNATGVTATTCVTDPAGRPTTYDFDSANHLIRVVNPDRSVLLYSYGNACGSSDGAGADQLCSASDPRGAVTSFTYTPDPFTGQSVDPAGGKPAIASVTDRRGATTAFAYNAAFAYTTVDQATAAPPSSCGPSSTSGCDQTQFAGIDTSGRVAEVDTGTPYTGSACPGTSLLEHSTCSLTVTSNSWDTASATCRTPDSIVDNDLCSTKRLGMSDAETGQTNHITTPDALTNTTYTVTGDVLAQSRQIGTSPQTFATLTNGYNLQFWATGATASSTANYQVAGAGTTTMSSGFSAVPAGTLFVIADHSQSLSPNGNNQGSSIPAWTPYLSSWVTDSSSTVQPNVLQSPSDPTQAALCTTIHANTGVVCETDTPADAAVNTPAGVCSRSGQVACTTYVYNGYGEKTQMTTPMVNSGKDTGSYRYLYYPDSAKDLSGHTSAGGWLEAVIDPTASYGTAGSAATATTNFVAFGYDSAGNTIRTWDRNTTTAAGQQASCYGNPACTTVSGYSQTLYGADSVTSCTPDVAATPWRSARMSVDALGDVTCYQRDNNGNPTTITPPRGIIDTAHNYATIQIFDADDNLTSKTLPTGSSDGQVAATTNWAYDGARRKITQTQPPHSAGSADTPISAWVYDAAGRNTVTYTVRSANSNYGATTCNTNPSGLPGSIPASDYVCVATTAFDGLGNPVKLTDATNATTTNHYDGLGRPVQTFEAASADFANPETDTVYDADGNKIAVCPPRAFAEGKLATGTCGPLPSSGTGDYYSTYTSYDPADHPVATTRYRVAAGTADGNATNPTVFTTSATYDADGNEISATDARGNSTTWTYKALDRKMAMAVPRSAGVTEITNYGYDPSGDTTSVTDPTNRVTGYTFDSDLRPVDTIVGYDPTDNSGAYDPTKGSNVRTRRIYDADGNIAAVLPPQAFRSSATSPDISYMKAWDIDTDGRPTAYYSPRTGDGISDPGNDGGAQPADCTTANRPASLVVAPGTSTPFYPGTIGVCVTRSAYDAESELTRITPGTPDPSSRYQAITYSDDGLKIGLDTPNPVNDLSQADYSFGYDGQGRQTTLTEPSGLITARVYNPDSTLYQTEVNASPNATSLLASGSWFVTESDHYDASGEKTSTVLPQAASGQNPATVSYNSDGTVASRTDTGGDVTSYSYDANGNPTTVTSPDANAKAAANPLGLSTVQGWTFDNLLAYSANPLSTDGTRYRQTSYGYDAQGRQTSIDTFLADANSPPNALTGYPKDPSLGADPGTITTTYDNAGRPSLQSGTNNGDTITTTYDPAGNPTRIADTASNSTVTASYYLDGLLYQTADGTETQTNSYDAVAALTGRSDGPTGNGGTTTTYTQSDAEIPIQATTSITGQNPIRFSYNSDGLLTNRSDGNQDNTQYSYYADDALQTQTLTGPQGTLSAWGYSYDNQGRINSQTLACTATTGCPLSGSTAGTWNTGNYSYSYDAAGRLASFNQAGTNQTITYDPNGNRTGYGPTGYFYGPDDAICGSGNGTQSGCSASYSYDGAGRLTSDGCTNYTYDPFGRTQTATVTASTCGNPATVTYGYDGLGRQTNDTSHTPVGAGTTVNTFTTVTYYDLTSHVADETTDSLTLTSYELAPNGSPLAVHGFPDQTQYLSTDGNNNIATVENSAGLIACATRYDPFGNPTNLPSGATNACSVGTSISDLAYQTNRRDQNTGTYQNGTRTYDPTKAAFTTPDSYLNGGSQANTSIHTDPLTADTYTYVNGDPLNFNDANGHHIACDDPCTAADRADIKAAEQESIRSQEASYAAGEQIGAYQHQVALDAYTGRLSADEQAFRADLKGCVYEQALCGAAGDIAYGATPAQAAALAQELCAQDNSMCDVGATYPDPTFSAIQDQIVITVLTLGAGTLIKAGTSGAIGAVSSILRTGGEEAAAAIPEQVAAAVAEQPAAAAARAAPAAAEESAAAGGPIRWGPHNGPGPLDKITMPSGETVASTFRSGSYTQLTTAEDTTLYHAYGGRSGPLSPFWTQTMPTGPLQGQLDLALNPAWENTAEAVSAIRVPAGTEIFEGIAGPQSIAGGGSLLGGGSQVYIPWVNPDWLLP